MQWLTLRKGAYCAVHPRLWPQLAGGVAPAIEHTTALQRFAFRTVVDVGANRGQFAMLARALFPDAYIFAFEPLAAPAKLFRRYLDGDGRIHLFDNAIGERAGARTIFVATQDDSSSLLQPTEAQSEIFGVEVARTEVIVMKRLADCLSAGQLHGPALLKIDVQGAELDVLRGSTELLDRFDTIYIECSYLPLYEGQPLVPDVARWMDRNGYELAGVYNQHVDPARGPVQADFLFVRPPADRRRGGDA